MVLTKMSKFLFYVLHLFSLTKIIHLNISRYSVPFNWELSFNFIIYGYDCLWGCLCEVILFNEILWYFSTFLFVWKEGKSWVTKFASFRITTYLRFVYRPLDSCTAVCQFFADFNVVCKGLIYVQNLYVSKNI